MFHIKQFTLRERIYPIVCTYVRIEDILLKRSLESVALISLYYRLQTLAESEGVDRSRYNFQRMFPAGPSPISVKSNSF